MQGNVFHTSGEPAIDALRLGMQTTPSTPATVRERVLLLHLWLGALQQQGADVRPFYEANREVLALQTRMERGAADHAGALELQMCRAIDEALPILEAIQSDLIEHGPWFRATAGAETAPSSPGPRGEPVEWPTFQGNNHNTGFTPGPGPRTGTCDWTYPVGLGWYAQPVVEDGRVYCASPGMWTTALCLDLETGEDIWQSHQVHPLFGIYKYPCLASTPVVQADGIVLREMNSHGGDRGQAKHLVYIDKTSGAVRKRVYAGHVDYRARIAPVAGNTDVVVYPYGVQDIYAFPPECQNFNRLICRDSGTDTMLWDVNVGDIDILAEAIVANDLALQGTEDGYLYAICLPGHPDYRPDRRGIIAWTFHAGGPVNTAVAVAGNQVVFGANNGVVYSLDLQTGQRNWQTGVGAVEPRARKLFTVPRIDGDRVYIGSADRHLHCLDRQSGEPLWSCGTSDWLRSRPVVSAGRVHVAGMDGSLTAVSPTGARLWQRRVMYHSWRWCIMVLAIMLGSSGCVGPGEQWRHMPRPPDSQLEREAAKALRTVRATHNLPALAGAIVTSRGCEVAVAVGVRKTGSDVEAHVDDLWHLGSETKAMTATLVASLVEDGRADWTTTIADAFPELAGTMHVDCRGITLEQLLRHQAGMAANLPWRELAATGTPLDQRRAAVLQATASAPPEPVGETAAYSNLGYVVAGAIIEEFSGTSWEQLLQERVFGPLRMSSAGFGGTGTPGVIDQPWPHRDDGTPMPQNGPEVDNPPVLGPAGTVHASINDWARFVTDQLRGAQGRPALLSPQSYARLHTPGGGTDFGLGWIAAERDWGRGRVLTHAGTNTMNYAVVWMAPERDLAVLICTNRGGRAAVEGTDRAAWALIQLALRERPPE